MKFCSNCGFKNETGAKFCANCGNVFKLTIEPEDLGPGTDHGRNAYFQGLNVPLCTNCGRALDNPGPLCNACNNQAYYNQYQKPGKSLRPLLLIAFIMLILGGGFAYLYFFSDYFLDDRSAVGGILPPVDQRDIEGYTEDNYQEILNTTDTIEALIYEQYEDGWQDMTSISRVAEQVLRLPGVEYVEPDTDHLLVKYEHGGEQLWLFDPPVGEAYGVDISLLSENEYAGLHLVESKPVPGIALLSNTGVAHAAGSGTEKAVILNALHDDPSYDAIKVDIDRLADLLSELGYRVDRFDGSEVDIERYKTLDRYDFILVAGHGGAGSSRRQGDWFKIQTGERAPIVTGVIEGVTDYWSDWTRGYISMMIIAWDPNRQRSEWQELGKYQRYWAVTDRFFEEYSSSFQDSIFVSWSCSGLKNDSMALALADAGNSIYIGWTDVFGKSPLPIYCIMMQLAAGNNLSEAFELIPDDWKTDTRFGNAKLNFYPRSAGGFTFEETLSDDLLGRLDQYCQQDTGKTYLWICDTAGNLGRYHEGDVEVIGRMRVVMTDIAFNAEGDLYGISFHELYRIDPQTAEIDLVGRHGIPGGNALVFGPDGTLYGAGSNNKLYAIDSRSGQGRELAEIGFASSGDLAFHNGSLYLSGRGSSGDVLVRIDPQTYQASAVGNIGFYNVYGLDTFSDGLLYGISGTDIIRIFPESGEGRLVISYDGHGLRGANGSTIY